MDFLPPHSWMLGAVAAIAALAIAVNSARFLLVLHGLARTPRYFRALTEIRADFRDDVDDYLETARPVALALGFEYMNTYRAKRRSGRHLRLDLWRAPRRDTLAAVSTSRFLFWDYRRTILVSVLDDGSRITTSDNYGEGDPLGLHGEVVRPGSGFRELHVVHLRRVRQSKCAAEIIGGVAPLAALEDLARAHVQQLADAGLARYHGETQRAWSYTLRGACNVYFRARPRQLSEVRAHRAAQVEKTAE